jgi:hypothetical protein
MQDNSGLEFWVSVSNVSTIDISQRASLTVLPENNHKVALSFSEGAGTTAANLGNVGGTATLVQANAYPTFTNNVPTGAFAPSNNNSSLDFGVIGEGESGRALDLVTSVTPTIGPMQRFTLTGWLNARDLQYGPGGNRILYSQQGMGSGGFDLVQEADGVLWIGINSWPDWPQPVSSARSSPRVMADPEAGNANWLFFAFTYDGTIPTGNASFYFGSPTEAAALDITADYDKGPIVSMGPLTIGNFSTIDAGARGAAGPNSRVFRGLVDEINVFNKVLTLAEIQAVQKAAAGMPVTETPKLAATLQGGQLLISWESTADFQLQYRTDAGTGAWAKEPTTPVVNGAKKTVSIQPNNSAGFYRLTKP